LAFVRRTVSPLNSPGRRAVMGQTALGYSGCADSSCNKLQVQSCAVAVAHHFREPPFGKIDVANCNLLCASKDGDLNGIMKALDNGADVNTRLPIWIRIDTFDIDSECENEIMDVGEEELPNSPARSFTPLMHAAHEGHIEAVDLLLRFGAQVHLREADGMQALHCSALSASAKCFRRLLQAGANILAQDNFGRDALECVPLAKIAADPSKQEWLQLFKEATRWSLPVAPTRSWDDKAEKNGFEARPAEETDQTNMQRPSAAQPQLRKQARQTKLRRPSSPQERLRKQAKEAKAQRPSAARKRSRKQTKQERLPRPSLPRKTLGK